ncbi:MAG: protein kinase [Planctomycetota bacterium]
MAKSADDGEDPDDFLDGTSNPSTKDRASEKTREYSPKQSGEPTGELLLGGLAIFSEEFSVPLSLGKYEIHGEIGRGGMGIVLKGFDPSLRRTVAIKILSPHLAQSQVARKRFQREARAAAAISHDNVLTIHSVEEQGETPFLVMEFVAGQSLKEYVAERGRLNSIEVIRLSAQIAQALAAADVQGVIHRDVKPGNVMLHEGATRVRLMDFGLARVGSDNADLTSHGHRVGTPAYMAPEQIRGNEIDSRADLFSLGCVMYCMVVGHSPFHGRTPEETIHKILDLVPARLQDVDPSVPVVLSEMVEKLLMKNPDDRYQSANEVAETLGRIMAQINQTPTADLITVLNELPRNTVTPKDTAESYKPPVKTRSVVAPLLVAAAIFATVGLTAWKLWPNPPEPELRIPIPGPPGVAKLTKIIVGPGPDATCATLSEAINRAAENCTITVVGPGPYVESLQVQGAALNGLTLTAKPRATIRNPSGGDDTHLIKDVSGVTVEGLDFDLERVDKHGVLVSGAAENVTMKNCTFSQTASNSRRSLLAIISHVEESTSVVRLQQCRFDSRGGAMCVSVDAREHTAPSLICEGCLFSSPFTQIFATQSCRRLRLAGNVFVGGMNAINLDIDTWTSDSRIEIVNNTFLRTKYWLGFVNSFRGKSVPSENKDSLVCNNLILEGEQVQAGEDQLNLVTKAWTISSNWSEQNGVVIPGDGWAGRLAELKDLRDDVPHRDVGDPDFLVPAAGSPLLISGSGSDLPYIGAKGPAAPK